ncbi:hypothetical protein [Clostridium butyricum]
MKRNIIFLIRGIIFGIMVLFSVQLGVFATEKKDKTQLEVQIEEQENKLKEDMPNLVPDNDTLITDTADTIMNTEYGDFNLEGKINSATQFINNFLIKTRSIIIITYGLFVALITIYLSTIGSRSLNKRRHGILLLIGNTILFLVYINIPLLIIYLSVAKENIVNISLYSRIIQVTNFLRSNSLIISILLCYLGFTKLIVSKNDLPTRKQGKYLIKTEDIILIILNIVPLAINFII